MITQCQNPRVSHVVAVSALRGPHVHPQQEITDTIAPLLTSDPDLLAATRRLHAASDVTTRGLALPLQDYASLAGFGAANDAFLRVGADLGETVARDALEGAGLAPSDVDVLVFTTVTGVSAPSLDALLADRLGMRPGVRRVPSFGLGCAGGAAGLGIAHELLAGRRDGVALLLSVELCSLTVQAGDASSANLVASGLFGDGAGAAVIVGDAHGAAAQGPTIVDAGATLYPGTAGHLGWAVRDAGFGIVLSPGLPGLIEARLADDVGAFLERHDLKARDIETWTVHAGGPRILDAVRDSLDLEPAALHASRDSLARCGNLSSASVLDVLAGQIGRPHEPGAWGVVLAFGPGVGAELVLLRWE